MFNSNSTKADLFAWVETLNHTDINFFSDLLIIHIFEETIFHDKTAKIIYSTF